MITNAKEIGLTARNLRYECIQYKLPKLNEVAVYVDMYNNKKLPGLPGHFNIPLPIISGFVETLLSKTDDQVSLTFNPRTRADYTRAKLMTKAWQNDSQGEESDWSYADRQTRKIAIFTGKGIFEKYTESDPEYKDCIEAVELEDFIFYPNGHEDIEKHPYAGRDGIWMTRQQLDNGYYDQSIVKDIFSNNDATMRTESDWDSTKQQRYISLNLNPRQFGQAGVAMREFCKMAMMWKDGLRYWIFFDVLTGMPVRCELLKDVFGSNLYPWVTYSTHEDSKNFLNKSPLSDVAPVAEAIEIVFNLTMDNLRKRGMGQRLFDPTLLADPNELRRYVPEGLVEFSRGAVNLGLKDAVMDLSAGIPDTTVVTERIIGFLDSFIGEKTGVTPSAQGVGQEKQATILINNLKQVADRLGLTNKYYSRAHSRLGLRWAWGQYEHMAPLRVLKTIGAQGAIEWQELIKKDAKPEFDIAVKSGLAEEQNDALKKKQKTDAMTVVLTNPIFAQTINPKKAMEIVLKTGNMEDSEISELMDADIYGNADIIASAENACEEIMEGKEPVMNFNANLAFLYTIDSHMKNMQSLKVAKNQIAYLKLQEYYQQHVMIVTKNEMETQDRKAYLLQQSTSMSAPSIPPAVGTPATPAIPVRPIQTPSLPQPRIPNLQPV